MGILRTIRRAVDRLLFSNRHMGSLFSVATDEPLVALTFDDGPSEQWTPELLELLKKHDAKATFFVLGQAAATYPDILKRARDEGHAIGSHGWSHRSLPLLSMGDQMSELRRCRAAIGPTSYRIFRPPFGHQSLRSRLMARIVAEQVIAWSGHISDWRDQTPQQLSHSLAQELVPGAIVLLHDGLATSPDVRPSPDLQPDRRALLEALDQVLTEYGERYRFVTVPELMEKGCPQWKKWFYFSREAM